MWMITLLMMFFAAAPPPTTQTTTSATATAATTTTSVPPKTMTAATTTAAPQSAKPAEPKAAADAQESAAKAKETATQLEFEIAKILKFSASGLKLSVLNYLAVAIVVLCAVYFFGAKFFTPKDAPHQKKSSAPGIAFIVLASLAGALVTWLVVRSAIPNPQIASNAVEQLRSGANIIGSSGNELAQLQRENFELRQNAGDAVRMREQLAETRTQLADANHRIGVLERENARLATEMSDARAEALKIRYDRSVVWSMLFVLLAGAALVVVARHALTSRIATVTVKYADREITTTGVDLRPADLIAISQSMRY